MKALKIVGILFTSFIITVLIIFLTYTSFIDKLDIHVPEKTDFIHPSRLLMKYEVFISGIVLRPHYRSFVRQLDLTGNEKILDFGSGSGGEAIHLAEIIKNKNGRLTCLDISASWLKVVKYRLSAYKNIDFIEGDITTMTMPPGSFDVIVLRLVLHDIPKAKRKPVISSLYSILKPGGALYIFEPISGGHSIDEGEMRSLFISTGFTEKYFKKGYSSAMIPPRVMGFGAFDKR